MRLIYDKDVAVYLTNKPTVYANRDEKMHQLWLGVPIRVFKKYTRDNQDKQTALRLIKQKRYGMTAFYAKDMNLKRWTLLTWMNHNYAKNFDRYFEENKG